MHRIAIALGALCLVAGVTMWWQDQPRNVGTVDLAPLAVAPGATAELVDRPPRDATDGDRDQPRPTPTASPTPTADPATTAPAKPRAQAGPDGSATDRTSTAGTRRRATAAPRQPRVIDLDLPEPAVAPVRLRAAGLDLTVPLDEVGLDDNGQMAIPADVSRAGWYRWGPEPGAPGNAVLAGHVDSRTQGLGAFARLEALAPGDVVETTDRDGTTIAWEVTGRRQIDKQDIDPSSLFRRQGPPRLVLVTCGGAFDDSARSYRANVVVVARPLR